MPGGTFWPRKQRLRGRQSCKQRRRSNFEHSQRYTGSRYLSDQRGLLSFIFEHAKPEWFGQYLVGMLAIRPLRVNHDCHRQLAQLVPVRQEFEPSIGKACVPVYKFGRAEIEHPPYSV